MLHNFSCAVGVSLTPENAPQLVRLQEKAGVDTAHGTNIAKGYFKRLRPFKIDQGETCRNVVELNSYDYPSGHATQGWTWALLLAELVPEQSSS